MININYCILKHKNGFIFANESDSFIQNLPNGGNLSIENSIYTVKNIQHDHLIFFENLIKILFNNNSIFIDVGAYVGTISLLLDIYLIKKNILLDYYLFEANPIHVECLKKTIDFNKLDKYVTLYPNAASSVSGTAKFKSLENKHISGRIDYEGNLEIETITIDSKISITHKNIILKIDTEGHEPHVLSGAMSLLSNNNCILILEIHPYYLDAKVNDKETMCDYLISNYDIFNIKNVGWPSNFSKINNKEDFINVCKRDGYSLTDVICFNKSVNMDISMLNSMLK